MSFAVATLVALVGPGASGAQASLFLDSWGVDYNAWAPSTPAPILANYVVEDWKPGDNDDGWLDPGYGGDAFDAEAAYVGTDGSYLYVAIVTGFPLSGRSLGNDDYAAGDIGLDLNSDGQYDYAVDVSASGALRSGGLVWENPSVNGGPAWGGVSDPLRVTSWNQSAGTQFSYASWEGRYAIEAIIDLNDLGGGSKEYALHWTMGCGNDEVETALRLTDPVPEPATLLLLGSGLGLAAILRRRRKAAGV